MSEYWKSQPRKFCDFCKCWITDNKPSVEFHEKGKKHQENVQTRISEIRRKGQKDYQAKQDLDDQMKKIEQAALKAYEKDLLESQATQQSEPAVEGAQLPGAEKSSTDTKPLWLEAKAEQGYSYYWHSQTGESRWEPPAEGYQTIEDQKSNKNEDSKKNKSEKKKHKNKKDKTTGSANEGESGACLVGPEPKHEPLGQWETVESSAPEELDLQLPPQQEYVAVITPTEEPKFKFKEKVVTLHGDSAKGETTGFKKRKVNSNFRKNARTKTEDDD